MTWARGAATMESCDSPERGATLRCPVISGVTESALMTIRLTATISDPYGRPLRAPGDRGAFGCDMGTMTGIRSKMDHVRNPEFGTVRAVHAEILEG